MAKKPLQTPASGAEATGAAMRLRAATPEERRHMIAEAAYYLAQRRGFGAGSEQDDWLRAEHDIDRELTSPAAGAPARGRSRRSPTASQGNR